MRAVEISQYGAPEVLKPVTRPDLVLPQAGSGEVLIRVRAAGVCLLYTSDAADE